MWVGVCFVMGNNLLLFALSLQFYFYLAKEDGFLLVIRHLVLEYIGDCWVWGREVDKVGTVTKRRQLTIGQAHGMAHHPKMQAFMRVDLQLRPTLVVCLLLLLLRRYCQSWAGHAFLHLQGFSRFELSKQSWIVQKRVSVHDLDFFFCSKVLDFPTAPRRYKHVEHRYSTSNQRPTTYYNQSINQSVVVVNSSRPEITALDSRGMW